MNSGVPLQQTASHLTIYKTIEEKNLFGKNSVGVRLKLGVPIWQIVSGQIPLSG